VNLDPYRVLGVSRKATIGTINAAFRKKAKSMHPDHNNGDAGKFGELMKSVTVLRDPDKRRKFDETGIIEEDAPNNEQSAAVGAIIGYVQQIVAQHMQGFMADPSSFNFSTTIKQLMQQKINQLETSKSQAIKVSGVFSRMEKRIRVKDGKSGILKTSLMSQAKDADDARIKFEAELKLQHAAWSMLDDYEF
jgi:curved DNA-binding protein CbpA